MVCGVLLLEEVVEVVFLFEEFCLEFVDCGLDFVDLRTKILFAQVEEFRV